ncbi:hypothetical protein PG997_013617 [Apiospora hydei]|uniref:Uncharacterized protein n=1 Tax=Apiospora hydei TaxID=1337664 RepID=A0ABR1V6S0_9PEZI
MAKTMDNQLSLQPAGSQAEVSPLLRIPREIRDEIYRYTVTVDQAFEGGNQRSFRIRGYKDAPHQIQKFRINRQIWAEVWDYLIKSNIWVEVEMFDHTPIAALFRGRNFWSPYHQFPSQLALSDHINRLAEDVAIRFSMEDTDGHMSANHRSSVTFAYHPSTYGTVIRALSFKSGTRYQGFTAQLHPTTVSCGRRFEKLLTPLCSLRGQGLVSFSGIDEYPAKLRLIQEQMNRPPLDATSIDDVMMEGQHYLKEGRTAELRGRFSDAMCQYCLGTVAHDWPDWYFADGTPESNSLDALMVELFIGFSRNAHKHVASVKKMDSPSSIDGKHLNWIAELGIDHSVSAMRFVGLTDRQRSDAHLYRAFNHHHRDEHLEAARDLVYATEVDPTLDVRADLDDEYDRAAYDAIQQRPGPQGFKLVECELPLIGKWKGDPAVWAMWEADHCIVMKLFRQRHNEGPDGEAGGTPEDLTFQYANLGITWEYDDEQIKVSKEDPEN